MKTTDSWNNKFAGVAESVCSAYYSKAVISKVLCNQDRLTKHLLQEDAFDNVFGRSVLVKYYKEPSRSLGTKISQQLAENSLPRPLRFQDFRVSQRFESQTARLKQLILMRKKLVRLGVAVQQRVLDELNLQTHGEFHDLRELSFEPINISTEGFVDSNVLEDELFSLRKGKLYNTVAPNSGNSIFGSQNEYAVPNKSVKFLTREEIIEEIGREKSKPTSPTMQPKMRESGIELSESMAKLRDFLGPNEVTQQDLNYYVAKESYPVPILKNSPQRAGSSHNGREFRTSKELTNNLGSTTILSLGQHKESGYRNIQGGKYEYGTTQTPNDSNTGNRQVLGFTKHQDKQKRDLRLKQSEDENKLFDSWMQDEGSSSTRVSPSLHRPFTLSLKPKLQQHVQVCLQQQTQKQPTDPSGVVPPIDLKRVLPDPTQQGTQRKNLLRVKRLLFQPITGATPVGPSKQVNRSPSKLATNPHSSPVEAKLAAYTNLLNFKLEGLADDGRKGARRKFTFESRSQSRQLESNTGVWRTQMELCSAEVRDISQSLRAPSSRHLRNKTNEKLASLAASLRAENFRLRGTSAVASRQPSRASTYIHVGCR